ncbi:amino acid ABC transporter substrate-binding protein [Pontibacterium granulatum]|uniref:amino acid ABC transporter substrate-binding protein n=1 Tax=Pontibacterium granulatum TaxID=2036029 RepID=UPI00249B469A|nr:amino acid ABC transporter substrate-binding protein [Pontibacterium granulatum]MDI3324845.1 amino acid ABC transporter substrate-binding protein [Pontibacterium granulatum]
MQSFWKIMLCFLFLHAPLAGANTLDDVRRHGDIRCGVFPDDPGRSAIRNDGRWDGFYVDFCRAVAAAIFADPERVHFVEVGATTRFTALQEGKTDVVMYSSTWTLGREDRYNVVFPAIYLFDGQGVMVRKSSGIRQLSDLDGKRICVTENTTTHATLLSYLERMGIKAEILFANGDTFFRGSCDAYSADRMNLAVNRANRADNPEAYELLPDQLSREPIGPMVRAGDAQWARLVRAVIDAMVLADEKEVSQHTLDDTVRRSSDIEVQNLLGVKGNFGKRLGLSSDWAQQVIRSVGNYSEVYQRHFGPKTAVGVEQGVNQPWNRGGMLYAPLFK